MTVKLPKRTTAEALLMGLRGQGFALRESKGKLLVSPLSKLTPLQLQALKGSREEILAILAWEATEPLCSDDVLHAWYEQMENPPSRRLDLCSGLSVAPMRPVIAAPLPRSVSRSSLPVGPSCYQPAPRRIVFAETGIVLAEPTAAACHAELTRLAALHPGQTLAAEWQRADGCWARWLTALFPVPKMEEPCTLREKRT